MKIWLINAALWEKFGPERDLNPWPLRYRCSASPAELSSQLGAGHFDQSCLNMSVSPQFKYMIFYMSTSELSSVHWCASIFLRSKCKDTLIKIGTSLWNTWKWCTEIVLSITVRLNYTPMINITNLPTWEIVNKITSVFWCVCHFIDHEFRHNIV